MKPTDLQFIYVALILPSLFGLTLIGEGLNKILKDERAGWVSIILGFTFTLIVIAFFIFFCKGLSFG
jgi:hypothetical protein